MKGYELRVRCCMLKDVDNRAINMTIGKLINFSMNRNDFLKELHNRTGLKGFCFSGLIPFERDFYREGEVYDFFIRSLDMKTIQMFRIALTNLENDDAMILDIEFKITEHKNLIESVFTTTPAVVTITKDKRTSSWGNKDDIELLETAIVNNLCRKFNYINGTDIKINKSDVIESIEVINKYPIVVNYKSDKKGMLGHKIEIRFKENSIAQEIANISYFLGLCTKNSSLGCGFIKANYRRR